MNPLAQFKVLYITPFFFGSLDFSFTNAACSFLIICIMTAAIIKVCSTNCAIIPNKPQIFLELLYVILKKLLLNSAGKQSKGFLPFIITVFIFIAANNILSIIPFLFTTTSHFSVTFTLSGVVFILTILAGFYNNGWKYTNILLPKGTPHFLIPLMIIIELFAFFARPLSLAIRLTANMIAGHVVIKVLASFILISGFFSFLPFTLLTIFNAFEIIISVLQAYIFTVLTCTYLGEAYNLH